MLPFSFFKSFIGRSDIKSCLRIFFLGNKRRIIIEIETIKS